MNNRSNADVYLTAFVAGLAAGVLGSRLLPPLISAGVAERRSRQGEDPFDQLVEDHREIVACLDTMEKLGPESQIRRMTAFLKFKRLMGKHAMAEEDIVYPLLHERGEMHESSKHLYEEHAQMKIAIYNLEQMIRDGTDWSADVRSLRDLIQSHAEEEETVAFPLLRQMLGQTQLPAVSGQISREEALVL